MCECYLMAWRSTLLLSTSFELLSVAGQK